MQTDEVIVLLAEFTERIRRLAGFRPGWPVNKLSQIRFIAIELAADPPESLDPTVAKSVALIREMFGSDVVSETEAMLRDCAGQRAWSVASRCYIAALGYMLAQKVIGEAAAAPLN